MLVVPAVLTWGSNALQNSNLQRPRKTVQGSKPTGRYPVFLRRGLDKQQQAKFSPSVKRQEAQHQPGFPTIKPAPRPRFSIEKNREPVVA